MRARTLLAGLSLVALAACAGGDSLEFAQFETDDPGVGDAALIEGIAVDKDGCLAVEAEGVEYVPIFPTQLKARAAKLHPGEMVGLGGSPIDADRLGELPGLIMPEACAGAQQYWLVVQ